MALTSRVNLKSWFKRLAKPTEGQFASVFDSFFHLSEDTLPISKVENLVEALAAAGAAKVDELPAEGLTDGLYILMGERPTFYVYVDGAWETVGVDYVSLTATKAVGGVSVGDAFDGASVEDVLKAILAPYVPPTLSSISITPGDTVEVGATITLASAALSWVNDSEGHAPYNPAISNVGFPAVELGTGTSKTVNAEEGTTVQRTTAGSEQWNFTAEDKNGNALGYKYDRVYWYFRRFFGASALEVTDDASAQTLIEALQQSWLDANRAGTATCTSDNANTSNYTYIAHAASLGNLSGIIMNGATPVLGAFAKIGTFNYVNAQGHTEPYVIYKSNAKGAFSSGDSLAIS